MQHVPFRIDEDRVEGGAGVDPGGHQGAVGLVAGDHPDEGGLAGRAVGGEQGGQAGEVLHGGRGDRAAVEVEEQGAVGGVGQDRQADAGGVLGLGADDRPGRVVLAQGQGGVVGGHGGHRAVQVAQHHVGKAAGMVAQHGAVEVHRPYQRLGGGGDMADDEGRVREIELQVEGIVGVGAHDQGLDQVDGRGHGLAAGGPGRALDLHLARVRALAVGGGGGAGEAGGGIGGGGEVDVAWVGAEGENRLGVGARRHLDVAQDLAQLVELDQVDRGRRGGGLVDGDRAGGAAALRDQGDAEQLHPDGRPVLGGGVAHRHGDRAVAAAGAQGGRAATAAAAGQAQGQRGDPGGRQKEGGS